MGVTTVERTVLFADIAGSTRLLGELGDDAGRVLLVRYVGLLADTARAAGGEVANLLGDEVFCIFVAPDAAAAAAASMHESVEAASARERLARPVRIRAGFVHGSVVHSTEGWFGSTVHKAARLVALAKAGQTLTTRTTLDRLASHWQSAARYFDRSVLRGGTGEEELHEILWDQSFTSVLQPPTVPGAAAPWRPSWRTERSGCASTRRGRASSWGAIRPATCASRAAACRACMRWSSGTAAGCKLSDVSTNGTTIERAGRGVVRVHHDSAPLEGEGVLWLGVGPGARTPAL